MNRLKILLSGCNFLPVTQQADAAANCSEPAKAEQEKEFLLDAPWVAVNERIDLSGYRTLLVNDRGGDTPRQAFSFRVNL